MLQRFSRDRHIAAKPRFIHEHAFSWFIVIERSHQEMVMFCDIWTSKVSEEAMSQIKDLRNKEIAESRLAAVLRFPGLSLEMTKEEIVHLDLYAEEPNPWEEPTNLGIFSAEYASAIADFKRKYD